MVVESKHVAFDESNNSILSDGFNELNINKNFDDESEDEEATN